MKIKILSILFLFTSLLSQSQDIEFTVGIDSNEVLIGDQIQLTVSLKYPSEKYSLIFPNVNEAYVDPFKLISQSKIDTIESSRYTTLQQITTIASYDSGLYKLDNLHINGFKTDADSAIDIASDSLLIRVSEVAVNVNGDIKGIVEAKKKSFIIRNLMITICSIILLVALYYFVNKYLQRKKIPELLKPIDAYEYANAKMQKIKNDALTNHMEIKNYYTTITDCLKYYLQHRFGLAVLDKTSDETIKQLHTAVATKQFAKEAKQILQIADMVKFAKVESTEEQNKNTWQQANAIIQTLEQQYQIALKQIADMQKKNG